MSQHNNYNRTVTNFLSACQNRIVWKALYPWSPLPTIVCTDLGESDSASSLLCIDFRCVASQRTDQSIIQYTLKIVIGLRYHSTRQSPGCSLTNGSF